MRTLYIGFKGKNNTSFQLVSGFSGEKIFLTNSFSGLAKDIDALSAEYDTVVLFGVDKHLTDSVRIECRALLDEVVLSTHLSATLLSTILQKNGVKTSISHEPSRYLCNDAYFRLLEKYNRNAILIHIPSIKNTNHTLFAKIIDCIEKSDTYMTKKAIFFDLDGTLTDSGEGIIKCATLALNHFGIPVPSAEEMRVFVGPPLDQTFIRFGIPADKTDEAIAVFRSRYNTVGKYENFPYPGIREMLEKLQADGFRLFVATSKPEVLANDVLEHFDLARYFELICGATLDGSRIHKADVITYLLEQSSDVENIIMVGDTAYDVIGAAAHKIPCVGVSWGYGLVKDMVEAGACAIADSPEELRKILET